MFAFLFKKGKPDKNIAKSTSVSENSDGGLGMRGEKLAAGFLKKAGYKILAKNYRCPVGEADIIALDKTSQAVVFVEVKTRSSDKYVNPEAAVNADKMRRLRKIARYYISRHDTAELEIRFDVIAVLIRPKSPGAKPAKPEINHIPNAFQ